MQHSYLNLVQRTQCNFLALEATGKAPCTRCKFLVLEASTRGLLQNLHRVFGLWRAHSRLQVTCTQVTQCSIWQHKIVVTWCHFDAVIGYSCLVWFVVLVICFIYFDICHELVLGKSWIINTDAFLSPLFIWRQISSLAQQASKMWRLRRVWQTRSGHQVARFRRKHETAQRHNARNCNICHAIGKPFLACKCLVLRCHVSWIASSDWSLQVGVFIFLLSSRRFCHGSKLIYCHLFIFDV